MVSAHAALCHHRGVPRRCETCGGRLDDDGTCARCAAEIVTIADAEMGVRREDRYVALPPGPRWVPRRIHHESSAAPLVVLAVVLGLLLLAVVLRPSERAPRRTVPVAAELAAPTGTKLLRVGPGGLEVIDVDRGRIRTLRGPNVPDERVRELLTVPDGVVALTDPGAFLLTAERGHALGVADAVVPAPDGFRLVDYVARGEIVVQGVEPPVRTDGEVVAVVERGVVVQRTTTSGTRVLDLWTADGPRRLATDATFVAATARWVVSRPPCDDAPCRLLVHSGDGSVREIEAGPPNPAAVAVSPGGDALALLSQSEPVIVDLDFATTTLIDSGQPFTSTAVWSRDGRWLFAVTSDGGIDAIRRDGAGTRFRVPVSSRATAGLAAL